MNLSNLYDIAFDMVLQQKNNGFSFSLNDNSTITIICTKDGDIFKESNGNKVVNGKLTYTCSETEAVASMIKANQSKIDTIITLNVENGDFVMPCENCMDLILQINKDNLNCNIMTNINESVKLKDIINKDINIREVENINSHNTVQSMETINDWDDGWDTFEEKNVNNNSTIDDDLSNPIPNNPATVKKNTSSNYYQSMYTNNTPTPVDSSISVSPINSKNFSFFKSSKSISDIMKKRGFSENNKKEFNKPRLFNNDTTSTNDINETSNKQIPSKKELMKLAKEKKKMAKKDAKILEATQKKR